MSVTMGEMLEAGVHFGHQTRFWNPKDWLLSSLEIATKSTLSILKKPWQCTTTR